MYYDCGKQSGIKPHVPLGQAYVGARVAHLKWPLVLLLLDALRENHRSRFAGTHRQRTVFVVI